MDTERINRQVSLRQIGIHLIPFCALVAALGMSGCSMSLFRFGAREAAPSRTTFTIDDPRGRDDVLLILALSGGGSRAAYFSTAVMFRLQWLGLLQEVDVLSSVSGGSLPAAYYAISKDSNDPNTSVSVAVPAPPIAEVPHPKFEYDRSAGRLSVHGQMTPEDLASVQQAFAPTVAPALGRLDRISRGNAQAKRLWDETRVKQLMKTNFLGEWFLRWFFPWNIVRYWLTPYSRTDIMAGVFADDLYDSEPFGIDLTLGELNPERPYLILNATDATDNPDGKTFQPFTFTDEDFQLTLGRTDVADVSVGDAVMTTAAFPAVFNYANLRDRRTNARRYAHLFDGGNSDNLGLTSADRVLWEHSQFQRYKHIAVILVDSYTAPAGVSATKRDPRFPWGYVVDTNFLDTFDALLTANRKNILAWFYHTEMNKYGGTFCHLTWEPGDSPQPKRDVEAIPALPKKLRDRLNRISTDFRISQEDAAALDQAAELLVGTNNECLQEIRRMAFSARDALGP